MHEPSHSDLNITDSPSVVVLVPTINNVADLRRCLQALGRQIYAPFRVVVVDGQSRDATPRVTVEAGAEYFEDDASTRADALNNALRHIECDIVVFTDDDCYPPPEWLGRLIRHFERPEVAGVGGPNIAPPDQSFLGKVVDVAFASKGMTQGTRYGLTGGALTEIEHNPGCNSAYRKSVLDEAGGLPSGSIGAEDVALDYAVTRLGHRLWFDPEAVIYHRRRDRFAPLSRQMHSYGRGRALVNAAIPELAHPAHPLPALAVSGTVALGAVSAAGWAAWLSGWVPRLGSTTWGQGLLAAPLWAIAFYTALGWIGAALGGSRYRSVATVLLAPWALGISHLYYGLGYLQGRRELRRGKIRQDEDIGLGKKARGR